MLEADVFKSYYLRILLQGCRDNKSLCSLAPGPLTINLDTLAFYPTLTQREKGKGFCSFYSAPHLDSHTVPPVRSPSQPPTSLHCAYCIYPNPSGSSFKAFLSLLTTCITTTMVPITSLIQVLEPEWPWKQSMTLVLVSFTVSFRVIWDEGASTEEFPRSN